MPEGKTALIAGASGLTGRQLLSMLLQSERYKKVLVVGRSRIDITDAKAEQIIVDFDDLSAHTSTLKADDVFCCLGTTMKKAGSKEAFKRVDYQYPLDLAKACKANGASQFLLVSALGANRSSSIFYNKIKGMTEDAVSSLGFDAVHFFRPSLLVGAREESRPGELAGKIFFTLFGFLVPRRYKGIDAGRVARAMIAFASREERGIFFHTSSDLQSFR